MRVPSTAIAPGIGWLPCFPFAYNELSGEPVSQCGSLSDQAPCIALYGPYAEDSGYCPSMMPGYAGIEAELPVHGLGDAPSDEPGPPLATDGANYSVSVAACAPDACFRFPFPWFGHRSEIVSGAPVPGGWEDAKAPASCYCKPVMDINPTIGLVVSWGLIGLLAVGVLHMALGGRRR